MYGSQLSAVKRYGAIIPHQKNILLWHSRNPAPSACNMIYHYTVYI